MRICGRSKASRHERRTSDDDPFVDRVQQLRLLVWCVDVLPRLPWRCDTTAMTRSLKDIVTSDKVAPPVGAYSTAVRSGGMLYLSGMLSTDAGGARVGDSIVEQTQQTLRNIASVLAAARLGMGDVVKVTSYLTDYDDFARYDAEYRKHFEPPFPARMTCVVGLRPTFLIEIDVIARLPLDD